MDNKTMLDYTLYCTEAQTKKALELGAPIYYHKNAYVGNSTPHFYIGEYGNHENGWILYLIPTAEQMIGWLRTKKLYILVSREDGGVFSYAVLTEECEGTYDIGSDICYFNTYKEATLASIDVALEYLTL